MKTLKFRSLFQGFGGVDVAARALARWQGFPDSYLLPRKISASVLGLGNAVPPLGYKKLLKPLVQSITGQDASPDIPDNQASQGLFLALFSHRDAIRESFF